MRPVKKTTKPSPSRLSRTNFLDDFTEGAARLMVGKARATRAARVENLPRVHAERLEELWIEGGAQIESTMS